jgi:hypothetical protein
MPMPGLVPNVIIGVIRLASILSSLSNTASGSVLRAFHFSIAYSILLTPGIEGIMRRYSKVVSSGAINPPRAPISMLILQIVILPSMLRLSIAFPQYSTNAGIAIGAIESMVAAQDASVKAEFKMLQTKARLQRMDLEKTIEVEQGKIEAMRATVNAIDAEDGRLNTVTARQINAFNEALNKLNALKADASALKDFEKIDIDQITGVTPGKTTSESYGNKAYELHQL